MSTVGERLTGTKELVFLVGARGNKTERGWYLDKSLAAACIFEFVQFLKNDSIAKLMNLAYLSDDERNQDNGEDLHV